MSKSNSLVLKSVNKISQHFEKSFLSYSLKMKISQCNKYELLPLFNKYLPYHQPILEAGCGSGRWVGWFVQQGWNSIGIDWSVSMMKYAQKEIEGGIFITSDMCEIPFKKSYFYSIVSLGSIEHSIDGPNKIMKEFNRILNDNGIIVLTVPYLGLIRKISRLIGYPLDILKHNMVLRKLLGKSGYNGRSFREAKSMANKKYESDYFITKEGWNFYQYIFDKEQMRNIIAESGFIIVEEFVEFKDEGLLHNFGRIIGFYDYNSEEVVFTFLGNIIKRFISVSLVGHMLCYVLKKAP